MGIDILDLKHKHCDAIDILERAISCTSPGFCLADTPKSQNADNSELEIEPSLITTSKQVAEWTKEKEKMEFKTKQLKEQNRRLTRLMVSYQKRMNHLEALVKQYRTQSEEILPELWATLTPEIDQLIEAGVAEALGDIDFEEEIQRMVHMVAANTDIDDLVRKELITPVGVHIPCSKEFERESLRIQDQVPSTFDTEMEEKVSNAMMSDEIQEQLHSEVARATQAVGLLVDLDSMAPTNKRLSNKEVSGDQCSSAGLYNNNKQVLTEFDLSVPYSPVPLEHVPNALAAANETDKVVTLLPILERSNTPNIEINRQKRKKRIQIKRAGLQKLEDRDSTRSMVQALSSRVETEDGSHVITTITVDATSSISCSQPLIVKALPPTTISSPPSACTPATNTKSVLPVAETQVALEETLPYTLTSNPLEIQSPTIPETAMAVKPYPHKRVLELQHALQQTEQERDMALELMTRQGKRWQKLIIEEFTIDEAVNARAANNPEESQKFSPNTHDIIEEESESAEYIAEEDSKRWSWSNLSFEDAHDNEQVDEELDFNTAAKCSQLRPQLSQFTLKQNQPVLKYRNAKIPKMLRP